MITLFRNLFAPPRHIIPVLLAAWLGLSLAEKRAERHEIRKEDLGNLVFYALAAYIFGGRAAYALENISAFAKKPLDIFSVNLDLFDPVGALAATILGGFIYGQRRGLALWNTLDALTPFFAAIAIGVGLSRLAAGTAFGRITSLPWGIDLWNATRHPTQLYETLAAALTLCLIWFKKKSAQSGIDFLLFVAVTTAWQIFILGFRGDGAGFGAEQIGAWILMALSFATIEARLYKAER
jgi:prolipoprotein diacylglyceryltransferase